MRAWLSIFLIAAFSATADAQHCTTYSTSVPDVDLLGPSIPTGASAASGYYVETFVSEMEDCPGFCFWIYAESNGIAGLQRGDEYVDDTCHGMIAPDTIIL